MHGFRRVIVSGWILLLLPIVGVVAAEGIPRTQFNFKTPSPVVYEVAPLAERAEGPRRLQAHERDRPGVRVEFGSQIILRLAKGHALGQATAATSLPLPMSIDLKASRSASPTCNPILTF